MAALLEKFKLPKWILVVLIIVFVLRIPSFFEPYYYGDEMIYLTLGQGVRDGLTLYKDIHDNKPPLLYLTAAIAGNLFWFKVILAFFNLITIVLFFKLAERLFPTKDKLIKVATVIFALLTTLPLFEGNIVNAELFMIGFTLAAFYMLLGKYAGTRAIFMAGFLLGIGALFKVPAAFDLPVIVVYWFITIGISGWKKLLKNTLILGLGFLTPIVASFAWYFFKGALPEYIKAAFLQNVGYLSSFRPGDVQKPFLVRNAPLLTRSLIVAVGGLLLFVFKKKLSKNFILITLWVLLGLFAVTLSERPYPHYFIQVVPALSLLLAIFIAEKSVEQSLVVIPLTIVFFIPVYYKFYYYPTASYYSRFTNFATGRIHKSDYFDRFSQSVNRNYEISKFLMSSSRKSEKVFMWDSDSSTVYALSRRLPPIKYVADYHINDFASRELVATELSEKLPKFIILTSGYSYPEISTLIKDRYFLITQIQNANIYSRKNSF